MRLAGRIYDAQIADSGLKTTQYSLLSFIRRLGPIAPGALARELSLDASTLTRNLRPMIEAGWVELGAGPDARTRQVSITEAGIAKHREARADWRRAQRQFNALLGEARVAELHRVLDQCQQILDDQPLTSVSFPETPQ